MSRTVVDIEEWKTIGPETGSVLYSRFLDDERARKAAALLSQRGCLDIVELREGLKISANSHVGRVLIGDLQVNVHTKLKGMPLYRLLRYAYGLRDMELFPESLQHIGDSDFYDILLYQLAAEAEKIIKRELKRTYLRRAADLQVPRGRIDLRKVACRGGVITGTLPCIYFERVEDNLLNRVLYAGLRKAAALTDDFQLKAWLNRLGQTMADSVASIPLNRDVIRMAWGTIDRLSEDYRPALELVSILHESWGSREAAGPRDIELRGFFFDMNRFFQRLLSRLLHDFLEGYEVRDEYKLHGMLAYNPRFNPLRRRAPKPRPDFAVMKGNSVVCLLDAKYRDLWKNELPAEMLYQLIVYASSGKGSHVSKILYPTMHENASVQKIDVMDPATGKFLGQVVLQPVFLPKLAELLGAGNKNRRECSGYVHQLVFG